MSLFEELKRRNVFRVAIAYVVASWLLVQATSLLLEIFDAPDSIMRVIVGLLAFGFIFSVIFAWAFEVTPEGIKRESAIDRSQSVTHQTAKRLDMLTIGLVLIAIGIFAAERFTRNGHSVEPADFAVADEPESGFDQLSQQILEIDRLKNVGELDKAFELASEIEPFLPDESMRENLWTGISWSADLESEPSGARVFRQPIDAAEDDWEDLGTTPLAGVRFEQDKGYRLRYALAGHRPVELLQTAVRTFGGVFTPGPVRLDPVDTLPEEMVRIQGFTRDLVDYSDFFMDRYEVTNREFQQFVASGGYVSPEYWQQPFLIDGAEVPWEQAMKKFIDRTGRLGPASWIGGGYPDGQGDFPVNGVSWYEAAAYAKFVSKELPTTAHVDAARVYDRIDSGLVISRSNLGGDGPWRVGHNRAMNTVGIYDLVGNVREWCWNNTGGESRGTVGAGWTDAPFLSAWTIPKSSWDRHPTNGFRLIRTFDSAEKLARLRQSEKVTPRRDLRSEKPPTDEELNIYRRMYAYDPLPLNAEVVAVDKFEHWNRERVEFDLPYGERGGVYLYVPSHAQPPYETVLYWAGSGLLRLRSVDELTVGYFSFIIRSGRVVAQPIFMGSFDRYDEPFRRKLDKIWSNLDESGTTWRDFQIKWVQDLSRTIDYLETRENINSEQFGYYGLSWGAGIAPIVLAVEDRIGPAVLNTGGLEDVTKHLPEADPLTFVRFVQNPVLMLNGEYDVVFPLETSQKPMFELLGTDPAHKKHYIASSGHLVPRDVTIRETLDWFDRYFGRQSQ